MKKPADLAGFLFLFLFYWIARNSTPTWLQFLAFEINGLEDFFAKGA
jgi:hypothetical protein